ncbi:MAG: hypothetical protein F6J97_09935 [Leptolyngbya sp. SIO4C1]|nr:hypothetical protein [Leptolyngbya sp. SIO4C1]
MVYTTQQLLDILDQELEATWRGDRVLLSTEQRLENPVIAKALGAHKLSKVFVFQDFREQIHQYQREHGVSGIIWHQCTFRDRTVRFPELHPQLAAIPEDKAALIAAKPDVIQFWRTSIEGMRLWRAGHSPQLLTLEKVNQHILESEWAEVSATRSELYLSLCWGNPKECYCDWAYPESGCQRIIAAVAEPSAIKV